MTNIFRGVLWGLTFTIFLSCSEKQDSETTTSNEPRVVEIGAIYDAENDRHLFQTETDTIRAGWTTFRFANRSPMVHFVFFDYLPEGKTSDDFLEEISPVFQESSYLLMDGKNDEAMAVFANLPEWFNEVVFRGGPGFVSPGKSAETTLFMKPGNYVMECYIKTADGTFHWKMGMTEELTVTADTTNAKAPESPTIEITTSDEGIDIKGEPTPGKHLVKVTFNEDNPGLIARDVHVAKLGENDNFKDIATWLDFNNAGGLVSTAEDPGPTTFIGGTHEMPKGNTAYFSVELEPGRYAWVTEQPVSKSMVREFNVPAENE